MHFVQNLNPFCIEQPQKLDPKCWLKWETSRELINEHEQKEIVYKFFVEHSEQMLEGVENVKSEIFEAANNASPIAHKTMIIVWSLGVIGL